MDYKGFVLSAALLLSSPMVLAADSDTDVQSNPMANTANEETVPTASPASTNGVETESPAEASIDSGASDSLATPSIDTKESATPISDDNNAMKVDSDTDMKANDITNGSSGIVTEVNNKAVIQGLTSTPTFTNVELRNNVLYIPEAVAPVHGFYFLTIGSTERVCSIKKLRNVKVLTTPTTRTVIIGKKRSVLYCYDRAYFNF